MLLLLFKTMKHCVVTIGSAIWEWAIPEKNQTGGVEGILFWKPFLRNCTCYFFDKPTSINSITSPGCFFLELPNWPFLLWNVVRDFITFFTKNKTYLFYVIILSIFIIITSYKEIRLSFKENKTFSLIIILYFKEIRLFVQL